MTAHNDSTKSSWLLASTKQAQFQPFPALIFSFPLPVRCDEKRTADGIQETLATVAKVRGARNSAIQAAGVGHVPTVYPV